MSVSTIPENTESLLNGLKTAFFLLNNVLTVREGALTVIRVWAGKSLQTM